MRRPTLCAVLAAVFCFSVSEAADATAAKHAFRLPFQPPGLRDRLAEKVRIEAENQRNLPSASDATAIPYVERWFPQKVDHFDPSNNNTFQQRYWIGNTFYKPGGPVIVLEGGETSGAGRIVYMQTGIGRYLTEALGGIGIVLEHRYYGKSYVTKNLTTESLKYLNTSQSLADNAYFAENLWKELPGNMTNIRPSKTPFISYGGSYAGAKSAFLQVEYPKTYFGSLASSAVVWAGEDFWEYNEPVRQRGDPVCVKTIENTAKKVDELSAKGGQPWYDFKKSFGVEGLEDRDAANVIAAPLGLWQSGNWNKEESGAKRWDNFCANLTAGVRDVAQKPSPEKVFQRAEKFDMELATSNYAAWTRDFVQRACGRSSVEKCLGTWDERNYQQVSLAAEWRLWQWQVCTEWGYLIGSAPAGHPTLISRLVNMEYLRRDCQYAFGMSPTFKIDVDKVLKYGGYNLTAPRLMYIDGTHDPWLYATAHSPHSPQKDRDDKLSVLIEEAWHHNDENGLGDISKEPKRIQDVHNLQIEIVKGWVEEFYETKRRA